MEPVPPASSKVPVRRASLSGADMPSMRIPAPQRARADGGGHRHGRAEHRDRGLPAGRERRVPLELAQLLAAEHGDEPRELRLEAIDGIGLVDAGHLEVQGQGARGHAEPDPAGRWRAWSHATSSATSAVDRSGSSSGAAAAQPVASLRQDEGGHLQRLRHVAGEAAVVLARHDAVEAVVEGEAGLRAELAHDGVGGELVVRVQPDGDRPGVERIGRGRGRRRPTPRKRSTCPAALA